MAVSYTCPSSKTICYSLESPATDAIFRNLQTQINRYAAVSGAGGIGVDGLIGEGTASAARKSIDYAIAHVSNAALKIQLTMMRPFAASRQLISANAEAIANLLSMGAALLNLNATAPPSQPPPYPGGSSPGPIVVSPMPAASAAGWWGQRSTAEKAIMGVGLLSAVGLGLILWKKPKRKGSKPMGHWWAA